MKIKLTMITKYLHRDHPRPWELIFLIQTWIIHPEEPHRVPLSRIGGGSTVPFSILPPFYSRFAPVLTWIEVQDFRIGEIRIQPTFLLVQFWPNSPRAARTLKKSFIDFFRKFHNYDVTLIFEKADFLSLLINWKFQILIWTLT